MKADDDEQPETGQEDVHEDPEEEEEEREGRGRHR